MPQKLPIKDTLGSQFQNIESTYGIPFHGEGHEDEHGEEHGEEEGGHDEHEGERIFYKH